MQRNFPGLVALAWALTSLTPALAQPTLTSPPPANGVSPSAPLVFTFSEPMNPDLTEATFIDLTTFAALPTIPAWSANNTVLTCTPSPAFPPNRQIVWSVDGENPDGDPLDGLNVGTFTTGSGTGGGGGHGTNAITTFSVGKVHHYNQASSGPATLDPLTPYGFSGVTMLASNRAPSGITLTLPTGSVSNMTQVPFEPQNYVVYGFDTDLAAYEATFPAGNYSFQVTESSTNQTVVINLPNTNLMAQPGAPHLTNFPATQAVDVNQNFVLGWDAFPGGTAADYIDVDIGTAYKSPEPSEPGALPGTARTFTIPAGALQPNSNYLSRVGFFHFTGATNASYAASAYRATYTEFTLVTAGSGGRLVLTNANWANGIFSFDVLSPNAQIVTVEYTAALPAVTWTHLLTTNNPGAQVHVVSTQAVAQPSLFFRAREGP